MKKLTSLSLSLACALASTAQLTITSADMPNASDSLYVSNTASLGTHNPSETGANYNWDYSDLKPTLQQPQKFAAPGKFPSIYNFIFNAANTSYGKNNLLIAGSGIPMLKIDAAYDFFKESGASFNQIGVGYVINATPLPFIYKHPDIIYKFPMNYLNEDSCDFDFGLALPGYGYYGQSGHRYNVVDGWGELKTPLGTYTTLRVFSTIDITDTLYIESDSIGFPMKRPARYEYKWFAANSKIPVLQIDAMLVSNQLVYTTTFIDTLRKDVIHVGMDENSRNLVALQAYPNPASEEFMLSYKLSSGAAVKIMLTDMLGKHVMQLGDELQQAGEHKQTINVAALPRGIYFVNLRSDDQFLVKKISIVN